MENKIIIRGSIWRKWDLQIHSPLSGLNNQYPKNSDGTPNWERFLSKLESIKDVAVFGVTDYFTIEGYKKILEYREQGKLTNFDLILPNIEFRLSNTLASKKDGENPRRLNFHVIFSNEVVPKDIEDFFLHEIDFCYEGNPQSTDEKWKLKISSLEELGKKLKSEHKPFQDRSDFEIGCMNATVNHQQITEILNNKPSKFKDKYLIAFPEEWSSLIDWDGQDHQIRKVILQKSDCIFSANPKTRDWALEKSDLTPEQFCKEFKTLKPCIHGSDAHCLDNICKPDNNKYCWIKADPTFEGLKQIIYEPAERVKIQEDSPEPRKSIYSIADFTASNSKGFLDEEKIELNQNLVAIIGGKGSGKTALVDLIANCFDEHHRAKQFGAEEDENSFVQRIETIKEDEEDKYKKEIKTALSFINDENFDKAILDNRFFSSANIVYLPQGKIERICSNQEKLDKFIKDLIFESKKVRGLDLVDTYSEIIEKIKSLSFQVQQINQDIYQLEQGTKPAVSTELNKQNLLVQGKIKDSEEKLKQFSEKLKDEERAKINKLQTEIEELKEQKKNLEALKNNASNLKNQITQLDSINKEIDDFNQLLEKSDFKDRAIVKIGYSKQTKALDNIIKEIVEKLTTIKKDIEMKEKETSKFSEQEKKQAELLKEKSQWFKELKIIEGKLKKFEEDKKALTDKESERLNTYKSLFVEHFNLKQTYSSIIDKFFEQREEILEGINFESIITLDKEKFKSIGTDRYDGILDSRSVSTKDLEDLLKKDNLAFLNAQSKEDFENNFNTWAEALKKEIANWTSKCRKGIESNTFYDWIFGNFLNVVTKIYFDEKPLEKLSIGQKGTVILKIYLAEGDNPIVLDQPEDNLDNSFIVKKLVKAFRQAKRNRQIIITTHNANLVVNTDAEQVIVAKYENESIFYESGGIENQKIRNAIVELLEGGKIAFKNREQKYSF